MGSGFVVFVVAVTALPGWAAWDGVPPPGRAVAVQEQPREIEAGESWATTVTAPSLGAGECPVLRLRARVEAPGQGGCNYALEVGLGGLPLLETPVRPRLLNKARFFDPPGTKYHFSWYNAAQANWMMMFQNRWDANWGGTGADCEFLFDLSGLIAPGERVELAITHTNPLLPSQLHLPRAPLVIDECRLGVLSQAQVDALRAGALKGSPIRQSPAVAALPSNATLGERPYEVLWSGRQESPRAQVAFDDLTGWTVSASGDAEVRLEASVEKLLWRRQLARLTYSGGKTETSLELTPPQPIPVEGRFDAADLWMYGALNREKDRPLGLTVRLADSRGREVMLPLASVTSTYWGLQHGVLSRATCARVRFPLRFLGLLIDNCKVEGTRVVYLESLAFYAQDRRPTARYRRPAGAAFPVGEHGIAPRPPAGVKVAARALAEGAEWVSEAGGKALRVRVRPAEGCLNGVTARFGDGPELRPLAGGKVRLDREVTDAAPAGARVLSSTFRDGRLTARWRLDAPGRSSEWAATYSVRGRTLAVDLSAPGGIATGTDLGLVTGLASPRAVEVPYLVYGVPASHVACGSGVFVSLLPDVYHSDFSSMNSAATPPDGDRIGLLTGTLYQPLTNGRRNDLRDRLLLTVSDEFAEVLPTPPNPASPHRDRLAPYLLVMATELTPGYWKALKEHGLDHVITLDFARLFVADYAEGFAGRWRPHPMWSLEQARRYREEVRSLGYLFGAYLDVGDYFPLNEFWNPDKVALTGGGDWVTGWYGNYRLKGTEMPWLVEQVGRRIRESCPPDCVYLDTQTCYGPGATDMEAGIDMAGTARQAIVGNGDGIVLCRKYYGSTVSEGYFRWLYSGLVDMDYATLFTTHPVAADLPPLVDFDLLKIHPLDHGTMMGYSPSVFLSEPDAGALFSDAGGLSVPPQFHRYVAASLAYGHMLMLGYGYLPPLARTIQYYALMQGLQQEYLTDTVAEIAYHDGAAFLPTSRAIAAEANRLGRVRVRYSRGLTICVNYHGEKPWPVELAGRTWELPPDGWVAEKRGAILAYSALRDGRRVDYVRCPEYVYVHSAGGPCAEEGVEVDGAAWLKREGKVLHIIPCGDLGPWERAVALAYPRGPVDLLAGKPPADRGCRRIVLDATRLLGKPAAEVRGPVRALDERRVEVTLGGDREYRVE